MIRVAVILLTAFAASAAPAPKGKEVELYFPVKVGTKWVLERATGGKASEIIETVSAVDLKDGVYRVTVERAPGGRQGATVYEVSAKGLSRLTFAGEPAAEPLPLLKVGVRPGDTWKSEQKSTGGAATVTYTMGKEEEVEVPAGKFKAIRVNSTVEQKGSVTQNSYWYAVGVGAVKLVTISSKGSEVTTVMKSFTPGK